MADHTPMQLEKYYTKEMAYTLRPRFCKVGYRPAQCLNSTQDNTMVMIIGPGVHMYIHPCLYMYL